eukprot:EG_transcript_1535
MAEDQPNRIRVFLRVRPPKEQEKQWFAKNECRPILRDASQVPNPEKCIIIDKSGKRYDFDKVFDENSTQAQVFKDGAVPTLENVFSGYCGAILAYGQTGTGKTHTMQGYDKDPNGPGRGIIPRCADYIFNRISKTSDTQFRVYISFVQIYLDKLQDLFRPDAPEININPETERVELPGITSIDVNNSADIMRNFYHGEKHRVTRATKMNDTSSRGHAALIVNVEMTPRNNDGSAGTKFGKLVLVDLAGYERFAATGITTGIAAEEAKKINASLLALGSVVNALADASTKKGQHHIPYRNAKLTRLLKDCLGGTSVTAIICTIGPCDKYNQETAGTLYFGWRAMAVKVDAKIKEMFDPNQYTNNLKAKIGEFAERIKTMKAWWSKGKSFNEYVAKYGDPDVGGLDGDEDQIMSALVHTTSMRQDNEKAGAGVAAAVAGGAVVPVSAAAAARITDDVDENDNPELKEVKSRWNNELNAHVDQAMKEEEALMLRQLQDLEEAKKAGIDNKTLAILKQEHAQELELMREQNALLRKELMRQKNKEEVVALLHSASDMNDIRVEGADREILSKEDKRIAEIVEHLQETSESKDEVLQRMFELICYYERQIENHDANLQAIAQASSGGDYGYQKMLQKAKARQEELQTALFLKDEEIAQLRSGRGGAGGRSDQGGLSALWAQASSVNPARADIEELQSHALLLKEKFEDACQQIIARSAGGSSGSSHRMDRPIGSVGSGHRPTGSHGSSSGAGRPTAHRPAGGYSAAPQPRPEASPPPRAEQSPSPPPGLADDPQAKKKRFWDKFEKLHRK